MINKNDQSAWPVWATEAIEIVEPDPNWLTTGKYESDILRRLLAPFGNIKVEHYGSTSIPDLPSKPIIDLMAALDSFEQVDDIAQLLAEYDWHYVPPHLDNRPWQRFFVKVKNDKRAAHLHLLCEGDERWDKQLVFRDTLRKDQQLTREYAMLKRKLASEFREDREAYTHAKTNFINRVLGFKE